MGLSPILTTAADEEEEVKRNKLRTVPVLPEDYPLFDWDDWPKSYNALKPGTPTTRFEKECWNAIVDTLGDAMEAAGLEFYRSEDGFTPEDIHITGGRYGVLTAAKMNNLIWAIDDVVHFDWPWEHDVTHPGYARRPNGFYGKRTNTKKKADTIHAQYILDIVHRLNLILQLMRDNYPYHDNVWSTLQTGSLRSLSIRTGKSVRVGKKMIISLLIGTDPLHVGHGRPITAQHRSQVAGDFRPELLHAAPLWIPLISMRYLFETEIGRGESLPISPTRLILWSKSKAMLETTRPVDCSFAFLLHSLSNAKMAQRQKLCTDAAQIGNSLAAAKIHKALTTETGGSVLSGSSGRVEAINKKPQPFRAGSLSSSRTKVSCGLVKFAPTGATLLLQDTLTKAQMWSRKMALGKVRKYQAATVHTASISALPAAPTGAESVSESAAEATILKPRTGPLWVLHGSKTLPELSMQAPCSVLMKAKARAKTTGTCTIGSAWDAPVWVDGGLWIRQVRTSKRKPDGTLDLSGCGDPIGAVQHSGTVIAVSLDNAWDAPVWVDGGLFIRQVRQATVLEDGSVDLTGGGDELLVQHSSKTAVTCALDTAWYPPVMVDGGLWIRQVQNAVQYENNELEVQ